VVQKQLMKKAPERAAKSAISRPYELRATVSIALCVEALLIFENDFECDHCCVVIRDQ
jgi:hypothetical protein